MSSHTPGPWKIEYDELTEEWFVYWKRGYASVGGFGNLNNARLIAAAPEMLEALENILNTGLPRNRYKAEKAVAKAKGETG